MTGKSFHDRQCKARFNIRKQKWSLQIYVHNTTVDKCNSKIKIYFINCLQMKVWAFMSLFANNMRFKSLKSKLILVWKESSVR